MWNGDPKANLGITLFILSIVIILIFIIAFVGVYISRKYAMSAKLQMRFYDLKE